MPKVYLTQVYCDRGLSFDEVLNDISMMSVPVKKGEDQASFDFSDSDISLNRKREILKLLVESIQIRKIDAKIAVVGDDTDIEKITVHGRDLFLSPQEIGERYLDENLPLVLSGEAVEGLPDNHLERLESIIRNSARLSLESVGIHDVGKGLIYPHSEGDALSIENTPHMFETKAMYSALSEKMDDIIKMIEMDVEGAEGLSSTAVKTIARVIIEFEHVLDTTPMVHHNVFDNPKIFINSFEELNKLEGITDSVVNKGILLSVIYKDMLSDLKQEMIMKKMNESMSPPVKNEPF